MFYRICVLWVWRWNLCSLTALMWLIQMLSSLSPFLSPTPFPYSGDWMCTFCRSLTNPEIEYNCDDDPPIKKDKSEHGLSPEDQRVSSWTGTWRGKKILLSSLGFFSLKKTVIAKGNNSNKQFLIVLFMCFRDVSVCCFIYSAMSWV